MKKLACIAALLLWGSTAFALDLGKVFNINFQPTNAPSPGKSWLIDSGAPIGNKGPMTPIYGWNKETFKEMRDRNNPGTPQQLDTLVHIPNDSSFWTMRIKARTTVRVTVSVGDPKFGAINTVNVESTKFFDRAVTKTNNFLKMTKYVTISKDNKLTIDAREQRRPSDTKINYVIIEAPASSIIYPPEMPFDTVLLIRKDKYPVIEYTLPNGGFYYTLERSENLLGNKWVAVQKHDPIINIQPGNTTYNYIDMSQDPMAFFRLTRFRN